MTSGILCKFLSRPSQPTAIQVLLSFVYTFKKQSPDKNHRYYFQLLSTEAPTAYGFYSIIQYFGWKRVGIITQGENLFIAVSGLL